MASIDEKGEEIKPVGAVEEESTVKEKDQDENTQEESQEETPTSTSRVRGRVITDEQTGVFQDLGLGRGVDATNPTPWLNKRAFQVRKVNFENIIGTEEGDLYQGFVNEVESTEHLQTNLSASVPVSQLVGLGMDSELSRNYSVSQKSVGRKVITRTISFRADFDGIMQEAAPNVEGKALQLSDVNFEQFIKLWIEKQKGEEIARKKLEDQPQKKLEDQPQKKPEDQPQKKPEDQPQKKQEDQPQKKQEDQPQKKQEDQPQKKLEDQPQKKQEDQPQKEQKPPLSLFEHCYNFISTFSITHYVYSLELGASYYRVMSLEEYEVQLSAKAKLGVGQMADFAIGNKKSWHSRKFKSQTTMIGRMKEVKDKDAAQDPDMVKKEVRRDTIEEAVVGVKLQPISSMIFHDVNLRLQLQNALQQYIRNKQEIKFGPFYIACNWDRLYLMVNKDKDFQVEATHDIDKATKFFIVRCDEGDNHFNIVYEAPNLIERSKDIDKFEAKVGGLEHKPSVSMYLCAFVNWRGRSKRNQSLRMCLDGKSANSQMAIHSRKSSVYIASDLTEWVNEKEVFFINCQEWSVKSPRSSYLCVYESGETTCKPKITSHDDKRKFMLFRLIKPKKQQVVKPPAQGSPAQPEEDTIQAGPFFISTTFVNQKVFFKVKHNDDIDITDQQSEASQFYVRRIDEYSKHFQILSSEPDDDKHITATVAWRGYSSRPLQLRSDANGWYFLAIHDRATNSLKQMPKPEHPRKWITGQGEFYISCYTKPIRSRDISYLSVHMKPPGWRRDHPIYTLGCVPSIDQNAKDTVSMLFKLNKVPPARPLQPANPPRVSPVEETDAPVTLRGGSPLQVEVMQEVQPPPPEPAMMIPQN